MSTEMHLPTKYLLHEKFVVIWLYYDFFPHFLIYFYYFFFFYDLKYFVFTCTEDIQRRWHLIKEDSLLYDL